MKKIAAMIGAVWALVSMVIVAMSVLHAVPVGTLPVTTHQAATVASSGTTSIPELVAPPACDEYSRAMEVRLRTETSAELLLQLAHEGATQQTAQCAVDGWRDRSTTENRVVSPAQTFVTSAWTSRSGSNGLSGSWKPPHLTVGGQSVRFLRLEELLRANPGRWSIRRHDVYFVDIPQGVTPPSSTDYLRVTKTTMARIAQNPLTPNSTRYTLDLTTPVGISSTYAPSGDATELSELFVGTPGYVPPGTVVHRTINWKVYATAGRLSIPRRGYERQVRQACLAIPQVAGTINTPSREQRRLLARLLSRLDHVDEDPAAPADLKPVVAHARDLVMAALERRLDADQVEIDAARAEGKAWKAAYMAVVDFAVRIQVSINIILNYLARTGAVIFILAVIATLLVISYRRRVGPPPIPGDLIKRIKGDLLSEIEGDLTFMTHFMMNNRTVAGLNDEDGAYIDGLNVHASIGEQIVDGVSRFFAVYGRVAQLVAKSVPTNKSDVVPVLPPPAVFKDLKGNEHPRTDDKIAEVLGAIDAAAFQRGVDSVVIPTPSTPSILTFIDRRGETVALGDQDAFTAFEDRVFNAGATSRDDAFHKLDLAHREALDLAFDRGYERGYRVGFDSRFKECANLRDGLAAERTARQTAEGKLKLAEIDRSTMREAVECAEAAVRRTDPASALGHRTSILAALAKAGIIHRSLALAPFDTVKDSIEDDIAEAGRRLAAEVIMRTLLDDILGVSRLYGVLNGEKGVIEELRLGALILASGEVCMFGVFDPNWIAEFWKRWNANSDQTLPAAKRAQALTGRMALVATGDLPTTNGLARDLDFTGPISINPQQLITTAEHDAVCLDAHRREISSLTAQRKIPTWLQEKAHGRTKTRASSVPPGFVFHAGTGMLLPADLSESLVLAPPGDAE